MAVLILRVMDNREINKLYVQGQVMPVLRYDFILVALAEPLVPRSRAVASSSTVGSHFVIVIRYWISCWNTPRSDTYTFMTSVIWWPGEDFSDARRSEEGEGQSLPDKGRLMTGQQHPDAGHLVALTNTVMFVVWWLWPRHSWIESFCGSGQDIPRSSQHLSDVCHLVTMSNTFHTQVVRWLANSLLTWVVQRLANIHVLYLILN